MVTTAFLTWLLPACCDIAPPATSWASPVLVVTMATPHPCLLFLHAYLYWNLCRHLPYIRMMAGWYFVSQHCGCYIAPEASVGALTAALCTGDWHQYWRRMCRSDHVPAYQPQPQVELGGSCRLQLLQQALAGWSGSVNKHVLFMQNTQQDQQHALLLMPAVYS